MYQFYFNDCIPDLCEKHSISTCFITTLTEYNALKKIFPEHVDGIVTSTQANSTILNSALPYSLEHCIQDLKDKDERGNAYRLFSKYPIETFFTEIDVDDLLVKEYEMTISGHNHTAINPVIVSTNGGVLFTLALHNDLQKNILLAIANDGSTVEVNNLYGSEPNTEYIKSLIEKSILSQLENFEKLLSIIGKTEYTSRFEKGFKSLSSAVQLSIIKRFKAAEDRNGNSPFFVDNDIIKDVTPMGTNFVVSELRIFDPVAFRVYFHEGKDKTYLAMVEKKPAAKKQSNHIDTATSILTEMLMIDNR